jgi:peptidoglycan/xylan/chitin deacetylase (PgdA/CDA1 family)
VTGAAPGVLLTFDTELFWGLFFQRRFAKRQREMAEVRPVLDRILRILDHREIPATFAVVGRLFLQRGEVGDGPLHPDLPPDWSTDAAAEVLAHPKAWFGSDVVKAILASPGGHEIGGHGFTHCDEDRLDEARADAEIHATCEAAAARGVEIRSWVHPRNRVRHEGLLARHGIVCRRAAPAPRARALRFLDQLLLRGPLTGLPCLSEDGLVLLPAGVPILPADGLRRMMSRSRRRALVRRGIDEALRTGGLCHLWTHPHNFVRRSGFMLAVLEDAADEIVRARDADGLVPMTMGQAAARFLADPGGAS